MLRKYLLLFHFVLITFALQAQFGINASYRINDMPELIGTDINNPAQEENLLESGFNLGLDYWIPLSNIRIELLPELNYGRYTRTFESQSTLKAQFFNFFFNVNFYLFDLMGDCDCPTFSKQGSPLSKGFFAQISPGFSFVDTAIKETDESAGDWGFNLGAGIGMDIGLSDLITLTPMAGVRYYPNTEFAGMYLVEDGSSGGSKLDNQFDILQWHAGLRLGFRLDQ